MGKGRVAAFTVFNVFYQGGILAGPLVELAPRFAQAVRPGGHLALSGLLLEQADTVTSAYRPWFDIATAATRDGWALLAGRRRAD